MNDLRTPDPAVLDLLVEWEETRTAGRPIGPADLCRYHPDLLDEVQRHLRGLGRLDRLMAIAPVPPGERPPLIPGFEMLDEVGRGGMGVVYRARDLRLDRIVAVKVPRGAADVRLPRDRFEREARVLARLRHPNIVPVYAAGTADQPYFVMDYVPGGSLADRRPALAGRPGKVAALLEQVARAVHHAHQNGVVHRDLKPSNVLIDGEGRPLVGDFGVAGMLADAPAAPPETAPPAGRPADRPDRLTRTGAVGTLAYSAPELFRPGVEASPATDVWSLGVTLYELLTGELPLRDDDTNRLAAAAGSAPRPRGLARPVIPPGLREIVLKCLERNPAARYPSSDAVAMALARWRRRRWLRRRVREVGVFAVPVVLLFGLLMVGLWPKGAEARHRDTAGNLLAEVARGPVELVPPRGAPKTHLVRVNQALTKVGVTEEGYFSADAPRPALVELLPEVPFDRYRLTAEVRQEACMGNAQAGLYLCHEVTSGGGGPEQRLAYLAFTDLGPAAAQYLGPDGRAGGSVRLRHLTYAPPDPPLGRYEHGEGPRVWYPRPALSPGACGPWRRLVVEVSPTVIRCSFDSLRLADCSFKMLDQLQAGAPAQPGRVNRRGGVGLFVDGCKATVRDCRVEPLPNF